MPVHDVTSNETAAITAAAPVASISAQLQERMDREGRAAALARGLERAQLQSAVARLSTGSPVYVTTDDALLEHRIPPRS